MSRTTIPTQVTLSGHLTLEEFIAIARYHTRVSISSDPQGITGLPDDVSENADGSQDRWIRANATSVGKPLAEEQVRAIMLMILQNTGAGHIGLHQEVHNALCAYLNAGVIPCVPGDGSANCRTIEANVASLCLGDGKAYYHGQLMDGSRALKAAGLSPVSLSSRDGAAIVNTPSAVTALGALALYDMLNITRTADIIAALSIETLKGSVRCFEEHIAGMHPTQRDTADNLRRILADSEVVKKAQEGSAQAAFSLYCVPQLHGAVKKVLQDALPVFDAEMNPFAPDPENPDRMQVKHRSAYCFGDSFVGMSADSFCISATNIAKMSERRNNRMIDGNLSGYSWFLVKNPGLNCGLMVPQYTQAGLINEMRILSHPATIDNVPICGNQEDLVSMGYNACRKACRVIEKLEYVLAIELLSCFEAQEFMNTSDRRSSVAQAIYEEIGQYVPFMENDFYLYPSIEMLRKMIHDGKLVEIAESLIGGLK